MSNVVRLQGFFVKLQDFNPKLSDFGFAKYGPQGEETHVFTRVLGTKGYFAPEYIGTGTCQSSSIGPELFIKKATQE